MTRMLLTALLLALAVGAVACDTIADETQPAATPTAPEIIERGSGAAGASVTGSATDSDTGSQGEAGGDSGATLVARMPPTATPTAPPDPLSVVASDVLPDIVVPLGAELLKHAMATDTTDASADYVVADVDDEALLAWFREHMVENGWVEEEERDGALIFLHEEQLSARYADEERKRTATVFFGTIEDLPDDAGSFTIVVEAPYVDEAPSDAATEEGGDAAGEGTDEGKPEGTPTDEG